MSWSYDAIADVYATDMGSSMPFDDVAYYRAVCARQRGLALELGCGTGRILLELLDSGIDACGVDRSGPMLHRLRRDANTRGLAQPRVAQMDLRQLAVRGRFATILAPYSLVTYLTEPADLAVFLHDVRSLLAPQGLLLLDAFVPRDVAAFGEFRLDYRRPHGAGALERYKRIDVRPDGSNRIERRYVVFDGAGRVAEEFLTCETIRPYRVADLQLAAAGAGLGLRRLALDYDAGPVVSTPRFATLELGAD